MSRLSASGPHRSSLWRRLRPRENAATLLRGARAAALALAAFATLAVGFPAAAQAAVLVSNIGQNDGGAFATDVRNGAAFTTGSNDATLTSIELRLENTTSAAVTTVPTVHVYAGTVSGGFLTLGTEVAELTGPSSLAAGIDNYTFMAPANTTLEGSSTYYVITGVGGASVKLRYELDRGTTSQLDSGGESGWDIPMVYASGTNFQVSGGVLRFLMRVNGTVGGTPTNNPPTVATEIPNQTAMSGTVFSYQFPAATFADADSDTLTYTATLADDTMLPSWLSFTAATRTFSGTPTAAETVSVKGDGERRQRLGQRHLRYRGLGGGQQRPGVCDRHDVPELLRVGGQQCVRVPGKRGRRGDGDGRG